MARRHIFPVSSGEVDWRQVVRLQSAFTETLKAEQPAIAKRRQRSARRSSMRSTTQSFYEGKRARLARLYLRLALRGDYALEPSAEAGDPDLGVYG